MSGTATRQDIERIYRARDDAHGRRDLEASLYAAATSLATTELELLQRGDDVVGHG